MPSPPPGSPPPHRPLDHSRKPSTTGNTAGIKPTTSERKNPPTSPLYLPGLGFSSSPSRSTGLGSDLFYDAATVLPPPVGETRDGSVEKGSGVGDTVFGNGGKGGKGVMADVDVEDVVDFLADCVSFGEE